MSRTGKTARCTTETIGCSAACTAATERTLPRSTAGREERTMDETTARAQVAETGRLLLEKRLVARTWGNFSCQTDETHFCITPSGLGYEAMTAEDIVRYDLRDGSWQGTRKPSSEKGIHAAAYALLPNVGFVVHTHQIYATALGLTGEESLRLSESERRALGGIAWAKYGLPGTKTLKKHVADAMASGARTVLMVNHGALVCGRDRKEAIDRALLLEDLCRRSCLGQEGGAPNGDVKTLLERARAKWPHAAVCGTPEALAYAALRTPLHAQLDDMAQMIGAAVPRAVDEFDALRLLERHNAVLLDGLGFLVRGDDAGDAEALCLLTHKAAVAALHCRAAGKRVRLSPADTALMRAFYLKKYSKRKDG
ncbi:MAG: class II aldolase/adducin family protein [Ruminococcaceae bacterium]|nr:class II aldolase/adducin family protein [Oscillospiraceae bacterium]